MSAPTPVFIAKAFAKDAGPTFRNDIPTTTATPQRASLSIGFPPLVMTPVGAGGKPMLGPDMNGILYALSTHTVYQQTGQPYKYSSDVVGALGGYAVGTLLGSVDGLTLWYNVSALNVTDPDTGGAGWIAMFSYGISPITGLIGGVRTLSLAEAAKSVINLTGTLVANQQIVLPTQVRRWLIANNTGGAFSVTVKTAGGSGVIVPQGGFAAPVEVWGDGTNIYNVVAPVSIGTVDQNATPLTIAQRTSAGYLLAVYFNQSSALENFPVSAVFAQTGADGYLRKISPGNLATQIALSQFAGQVTNAQVPASAVAQFFSTGFSANDSITLPGGLIIKWCEVFVGDVFGNFFGTVNWPTAFPNALLKVLPGLRLNDVGTRPELDSSIATFGENQTGAGFTVQEWAASAQNLTATFIAIGF